MNPFQITLTEACYQCAGSSKYRNLAEEILKVGHAQISAQVFGFFELAASTENFNPDCLVGEGGFGRVYKGYIESIEKVSLSLSTVLNDLMQFYFFLFFLG